MEEEEDEKEEEDYMSDKFVCEAVSQSGADSRGSRKRHRRGHDGCGQRTGWAGDKPRPQKRERKREEEEKREKGLSTPLTDNNRGFSMLHRMGYRPGMGLGKEGQGRTAPVPLTLKEGKQGLGREVYVKETAKRRKAQEVKTVALFLQSKQKHFDAVRAERDMWKSQLSCQQLDMLKGKEKPVKAWYWPPVASQNEEEERDHSSNADDLATPPPLSEELADLTAYLRSEHNYCVWCGTVFNGDADLQNSCPGNTAEDHD